MRRTANVAIVVVLLTSLAWGDIGFLAGRVLADSAAIEENTPVLTMPTGFPAAGNSTVTVPVHFTHNLQGVAALAFSLNYDPACLAVDLNNGMLAPGVVAFNLPPQFNGSAYYDADDPDGRLDIVLGDYATPLTTLPNLQSIVTIRFRTICMPPAGTTIVAPITYSSHPAPSFSNTLGHPITGRVVEGSVAIQRTLPPATPTPTSTPGPTPVLNSAPIAKDDSAATKLLVPVTVSPLANDVDPDGDPLNIVSVTQGGIGSVTMNGNGTVTYTPDSERSGEDRFTYTVSDGRGGLAAAAVWVTVTPANKPPLAVNDSASTDEDVPVTINVLANDSDPDGDDALLSIGVLGQPAHGRVQQGAGGRAVYTPDANYSGTDSFVYAVVDAEGGSALATVSITVRPVNDPAPDMEQAADLLDFTAHTVDGNVQLDWTARSETESAGYYVYRTQGTQIQMGLMSLPYFDSWNRISTRIDGKGPSGGVYRYIDDTAEPGVLYAYVLIAIDSNDNVSLFGPMAASAAPKDAGRVLLPFIAGS